jgi:hypothetical protein
VKRFALENHAGLSKAPTSMAANVNDERLIKKKDYGRKTAAI